MRKTHYLITFAIITLILTFKFNLFEKIDGKFLEIHKCPSCYGLSCNIVNSDELNLDFYSRFKLFNVFFNVKNVFYGRIGSSNLVLKKLSHTDELIQHDAKLCEMVGLSYACNVAEAVTTLVLKYDRNLTLVIEKNEELFAHSEVMKCQHYRILSLLYDRFHSIHSHEQDQQHFLTLLAINPEPLILETFRGVIPLPHYFEACGRVIVEEFSGRPLSHYYEEPWLLRANLALQLLRIADAMTENEIRIYITDPSADNFVVDKGGVLKMIDVENIVLVDSLKNGLEKSVHFNDGFGCSGCLSYDYEDLCRHFKSDHNYYAVCKGLLSSKPFSSSLPGGLLHTVPEEVLERVPSLPTYIEECAHPQLFENRMHPASSLARLLSELVAAS